MFFGGGNDNFFNQSGAMFNANDLTIISLGSGNDQFFNQGYYTTFNAGGIGTSLDPTLISFDTPLLSQGSDRFFNQDYATFYANDFVVFQFGGAASTPMTWSSSTWGQATTISTTSKAPGSTSTA